MIGVMNQLLGHVANFLPRVGLLHRMGLQSEDGECILHDHEKPGQDAGLGKTALADEIEGDGDADVAEVAVGRALDKGYRCGPAASG